MRSPSQIAGVGTIIISVAAASFSTKSQALENRVRFQRPSAAITGQIEGTWQLASMYQEDEGGEEIDQFGGLPVGRFMADRDGNFTFQIMSNRGRHLLPNSPPAVVMARIDGLLEAITYFGTYSVDVNKKRLSLRVAGCLFKGCDKTARDADIEIHGNTLKMTTVAGSSPTGAFYSYTVWTRQ